METKEKRCMCCDEVLKEGDKYLEFTVGDHGRTVHGPFVVKMPHMDRIPLGEDMERATQKIDPTFRLKDYVI